MGRTTAMSVEASILNVGREIGYNECEFSWLFQKLQGCFKISSEIRCICLLCRIIRHSMYRLTIAGPTCLPDYTA